MLGNAHLNFVLAFFPKFPTSHYFMREREKKKVISLKCFKTFSVQIILQLGSNFRQLPKDKKKAPRAALIKIVHIFTVYLRDPRDKH